MLPRLACCRREGSRRGMGAVLEQPALGLVALRCVVRLPSRDSCTGGRDPVRAPPCRLHGAIWASTSRRPQGAACSAPRPLAWRRCVRSSRYSLGAWNQGRNCARRPYPAGSFCDGRRSRSCWPNAREPCETTRRRIRTRHPSSRASGRTPSHLPGCRNAPQRHGRRGIRLPRAPLPRQPASCLSAFQRTILELRRAAQSLEAILA